MHFLHPWQNVHGEVIAVSSLSFRAVIRVPHAATDCGGFPRFTVIYRLWWQHRLRRNVNTIIINQKLSSKQSVLQQASVLIQPCRQFDMVPRPTNKLAYIINVPLWNIASWASRLSHSLKSLVFDIQYFIIF